MLPIILLKKPNPQKGSLKFCRKTYLFYETSGEHKMRNIILLILCLMWPSLVLADTKAEILMDLRTGQILHSEQLDKKLHPASLTKLMTLYVTFEQIQLGNITLADETTVSEHADSRPPSTMNLKAGQSISIADLIRGVAIQSANDGATALAEAVGGSERNFVRMMNETAQRMGLTNTNFENPHGLTNSKQLTTARDIATLGYRMYHDHQAHYGLFSQRNATVKGQKFLSTNRRFLTGYSGSTGLKTGYTRAAGYNLAATSERNGVALLSVVLGAGSSPERFERTVAIMDWGYERANPALATLTPAPLGRAQLQQAPRGLTEHQPLRTALASPGGTAFVTDIITGHKTAQSQQEQSTSLVTLPNRGGFRPIRIAMTDQNANWGVQIGLYPSKFVAEKSLLNTTLDFIDIFGSTPPSVAEVGTAWSAAYVSMSKRQAEMACRTLLENNVKCAIFKY